MSHATDRSGGVADPDPDLFFIFAPSSFCSAESARRVAGSRQLITRFTTRLLLSLKLLSGSNFFCVYYDRDDAKRAATSSLRSLLEMSKINADSRLDDFKSTLGLTNK